MLLLPTSLETDLNKIAEYRKAVAAFLVPALSALGVALTSGSDGGSRITASEWVTVALASLVTSGVVAGVSNADAGPDTDSKTFVAED